MHFTICIDLGMFMHCLHCNEETHRQSMRSEAVGLSSASATHLSMLRLLKSKSIKKSADLIMHHLAVCAYTTCAYTVVCCQECLAIFRDKHSLLVHQKACNHHPYMKRMKEKKLQNKRSERKHEMKQQCNGSIASNLFICNIGHCRKSFMNLGFLKNHQKSHSKPFKCSYFNVCNKSFAKKSDLNIHERTHKNEKCEICDFCQKKYVDPSNLRRHIQKYHSDTVMERSFVCRTCHKRFYRKDSLQKHLQTHLNKTSRKLCFCEICEQSFTSKSNLNRHCRQFHSSHDSKT